MGFSYSKAVTTTPTLVSGFRSINRPFGPYALITAHELRDDDAILRPDSGGKGFFVPVLNGLGPRDDVGKISRQWSRHWTDLTGAWHRRNIANLWQLRMLMNIWSDLYSSGTESVKIVETELEDAL